MKWLTHFTVLVLGVGLGFSMRPSPPKLVANHVVEAGSMTEETTSPERVVNSVSHSRQSEKTEKVLSQEKKSALPRTLLVVRDEFEQAYADRDVEKSERLLAEMGRLAPQSTDYLENIPRFLIQTRQWQDARKEAHRCLEIHPHSKSCLGDLAQVELQIGSKDEQDRAVASCLNETPIDLSCRYMTSLVRMNQGRFDEAVSLLQKVRADNGDQGVRFEEALLDYEIGIAFEGAGRLEDARESFDRACRQRFPGSCENLEQVRLKL